MSEQTFSGDQIAALDGLEHWWPVHATIRARFATGDFMTGLRFVTRVAEVAEEANHHPDLDLRYPYVEVTLSSHDVGAKTQRDVDLARRIDEIAADLGVAADRAPLDLVELGLDTWDAAEVRPFWAAVLGYQEHEVADDDVELVDPDGRGPTLWFQRSERGDEPRQRWHLDYWLPPELVAGRVEAALAAGGTLVSDAQAPRFTVLADPQGNKVCLCTHVTRSH